MDAMREPDEPAPESIEAAYDRLAQPLYRYALMILVSPTDAEDVVQRVFLAVMAQAARLDSIDTMDGYLRRAVRNECYSLLRSPVRRNTQLTDGHLLEPIDPAADDIVERLALERALMTLSPEQREVVQLKAFEGHTFDAIARIAGQSINTIAGRYRYALAAMRKVLTDGASGR
jgi:RNA polymerase sigma-70 factor, ECF subfamily